jgi:hypothetical protein
MLPHPVKAFVESVMLTMTISGGTAMFARGLLVVSGLIMLAYGVVCWIDPEFPAEAAGLFIATHDGYGEMTAVFGGFQASFGAILLVSAFLQGYLKPGLWLLFICLGTVAAARASVALSGVESSLQFAANGASLGIGVSTSFTSYTWGALGLEVGLTLLAAIALIRHR